MTISITAINSALDVFLTPANMSQETATRLITESFLSMTERPDLSIHRIELSDGSVDYDAWRRNRINIFQRWRKCETAEQREKFELLIPAILLTLKKHNTDLHQQITAGTSIQFLVSRFLKENAEAVSAALNGAPLSDFEREFEEAQMALMAVRNAYRQQQRHDH